MSLQILSKFFVGVKFAKNQKFMSKMVILKSLCEIAKVGKNCVIISVNSFFFVLKEVIQPVSIVCF